MFGLRLTDSVLSLAGAGGLLREPVPGDANGAFHKLIAVDKDPKSVQIGASTEGARDSSPEQDPLDPEAELCDCADAEGDEFETGDASPTLAIAHALLPVSERPALHLGGQVAERRDISAPTSGTVGYGSAIPQGLDMGGNQAQANAPEKLVAEFVNEGKGVPSRMQMAATLSLQPTATRVERGKQMELHPESTALTRFTMRADTAMKEHAPPPTLPPMSLISHSHLSDRLSIGSFQPMPDAQPTLGRHIAAVASVSTSVVMSASNSEQMPQSVRASEPLTPVHYVQTESAGGISATSSRAQPLQVSAAMLQDQVVALLRNPSGGAVHIRLDPVELGQVRISLSTGEGGLQIHVATERPETLDLLRKFSAELLRDLTQMGYKDLSMSFSDHRERGRAVEELSDSSSALAAESASAPSRGDQLSPLHPKQSGVDIRV